MLAFKLPSTCTVPVIALFTSIPLTSVDLPFKVTVAPCCTSIAGSVSVSSSILARKMLPPAFWSLLVFALLTLKTVLVPSAKIMCEAETALE